MVEGKMVESKMVESKMVEGKMVEGKTVESARWSMRSFICLIATVVLACCGSVADQPAGAWAGKGDEPAGASSRVVLVSIDQATKAWASQTVSSLDGQPMGPDLKRSREVFALIADRLAALSRPPAVLSINFQFPPHDGLATGALANALDRSPIPVVLSGDPANLDPRIYAARPSGHVKLARSLSLDTDPPTPQGPFHVMLDQAMPPLAVAIRTAQLRAACGIDAGAEAQAMTDAQSLAQEIITSAAKKYIAFGPYQANATALGIPLAPADVVEVSAVQVLDQTAAAELFEGSIVIIGSADDRLDLLGTGAVVPSVLSHVWTVQRLVALGCPR